MAKGSMSVARMISVLNFFIEHPKQPFTIAQIVKSLKLNRATCYAIATGLAEAGYLYRNNDKSYVLGPAIMTIAHKAKTAFTPLDIARLEIRQLADQLDAVVSVQVLEGDKAIARERASSVSHLTLAYPANMEHPLHPVGLLFLTPLRDSEIDAIFDKAQPPLSEAEKSLEWRVIEFARMHGYIFGEEEFDANARRKIYSQPPSYGRFVTEIEPERKYTVQFIAVPVFGPGGAVAYQLVVSLFGQIHRGADIANISNQIAASCARISSFITGAP